MVSSSLPVVMHVDVGIVIHWSMMWCNACSEAVGVMQHHIDRLAAAHIANAVSGVLVAGWRECSSGQCRGWQVAVAFLRHSERFWLARRPGRHTVHVRGGSCRGYRGLCTHGLTQALQSMLITAYYVNLVYLVANVNYLSLCYKPVHTIKTYG